MSAFRVWCRAVLRVAMVVLSLFGLVGCGDDDGPRSTCYSPTQNLQTAYEAGAEGCACGAGDEDVCIDGVALVCVGDHWQAVEDGPCAIQVDDCAPQRVTYIGSCEPAPRYHWVGSDCASFTGCSCEGDDCDAGFATMIECEAAYSGCNEVTTACGAWSGDTCDETEYCAYVPSLMCGAFDASSICLPRPEACDTVYAPVCGCDRETYSNACEANAAGTGISTVGECP